MGKKKSKSKKVNVHEDLKGFDIKINEFGEIITNFDMNKINRFLDENVDDKKLRDRDELDASELDDLENV